MYKDERDILDVLKFELNFLEKGGYRRSPREAWRAPRIFEDSPTCLNHALPNKARPCSECALMRLVPQEYRGKPVPCDFIALNEADETVDGLYRYANQAETEEVLRKWLWATIRRLEAKREVSGKKDAPEEDGRMTECAHPVCAATVIPGYYLG